MELPEIDPLEFEPLQALVDALFQVLWAAVRDPLIGSGPGMAAFGSDDQSFRIRMERFSNQKLAGPGSMGVGLIDRVPAEISGALKALQRSPAILRPPPDPPPRDPHGANPEPVHGQVTADL